MSRLAHTCLLLLVLAGPAPGLAQEDYTGTSPANFTYDAYFIMEMVEVEDGGSLLLANTLELR